MVLDPAANFVRGQTDTQINSTNTTLSVNDASIFPDPSSDGEYNVVVWDADNHPRPDQDTDVEILRVSARDTGANDLTVSRGQETTSGAAHPSGAAVMLSPTAKMFGDIETTFGNFWDAGNSELTADVNNSSTVTDEVASISSYAASLEKMYFMARGSDPNRWPGQVCDYRFDLDNNNNALSGVTMKETAPGFIWRYKPGADNPLEFIGEADTDGGSLQNYVYGVFRLYFITFVGSSEPRTAYRFGSEGDITDVANASVSQQMHSPRETVGTAAWNDPSGGRGHLLGEYYGDPTTPSIWRYDQTSETFTDVYSDSDARHIHIIQNDPENDGHVYAATGDGSTNSFILKSTDYGASWSRAAGPDLDYRSLGFGFPPADDVYWSTDDLIDGWSRLYKAPRSDLANPTTVAELHQEQVPYFQVYLSDPHGFLMGFHHFGGQPATSEHPLMFYSLENDTLSTVFTFTSNDDQAGGWVQAPPYRDLQSGLIIAGCEDWSRHGSTKNRVVGINIQKIQSAIE